MSWGSIQGSPAVIAFLARLLVGENVCYAVSSVESRSICVHVCMTLWNYTRSIPVNYAM